MGLELGCQRDWAAYVLGLDREQVLACRKHLLECPECRGEVEMLEGAAAALPLLGAPGQAAMIVRDQLLSDKPMAGAWPGRDAGPGPRPEPRPATARLVGNPGSVTARRRRRLLQRSVPMPALAGIGALLVAAAVTVVLSFHGAGSRMVWAQTSWATGGAAVELTGHTGQLLVDNMPAAPAGDVYEVWVRHGHGRLEPKATFEVGNSGQAALEIPASLGAGDEVVVSPRPQTGARAVRAQAVLFVQL